MKYCMYYAAYADGFLNRTGVVFPDTTSFGCHPTPLLGGGRPTGTDASAGAGTVASGAAAPNGADGADGAGPVGGGSDAKGTDEVG